MSELKYRKEAIENLPEGYAELREHSELRADDLVWSWSSKQFLRADSPLWKFSPLQDVTDLIFAARRVGWSEFEKSVPTIRKYRLKKNDMPYQCEKCETEILWLKAVPTEKNPDPKPNPIEAVPHEKGNLVINREKKLYRFATKEEIEIAREQNKNLYISHYATCEFAKSFRKQEKANV